MQEQVTYNLEFRRRVLFFLTGASLLALLWKTAFCFLRALMPPFRECHLIRLPILPGNFPLCFTKA